VNGPLRGSFKITVCVFAGDSIDCICRCCATGFCEVANKLREDGFFFFRNCNVLVFVFLE
jgi:hypothetical protein